MQQAINAILKLIAGYDAALATGHLSPVESLELIKHAKKTAAERIVIGFTSLRGTG